MFARVLAVANRKGGTGKSTVAVNLAAELGARGYHVLVADLDPQGHAGLGFGIEMPDASRTIHAAFRDEQVELAGAICATSEPGVDLIAADRNFDGRILLSDPRCLARAIAPIKPNYDVVPTRLAAGGRQSYRLRPARLGGRAGANRTRLSCT